MKLMNNETKDFIVLPEDNNLIYIKVAEGIEFLFELLEEIDKVRVGKTRLLDEQDEIVAKDNYVIINYDKININLNKTLLAQKETYNQFKKVIIDNELEFNILNQLHEISKNKDEGLMKLNQELSQGISSCPQIELKQINIVEFLNQFQINTDEIKEEQIKQFYINCIAYFNDKKTIIVLINNKVNLIELKEWLNTISEKYSIFCLVNSENNQFDEYLYIINKNVTKLQEVECSQSQFTKYLYASKDFVKNNLEMQTQEIKEFISELNNLSTNVKLIKTNFTNFHKK